MEAVGSQVGGCRVSMSVLSKKHGDGIVDDKESKVRKGLEGIRRKELNN